MLSATSWCPYGAGRYRTVALEAGLDGFIARRDGSVDWLETLDEFVGGDTLAPGFVEAFLKTIDCSVMGLRTYETALSFEAKGLASSYLARFVPDLPSFASGLARPAPDLARSGTKLARPAPDLGRPAPDLARSGTKLARPAPDLGRPAPGLPSFVPGLCRSVPDLGRPAPDLARSGAKLARPVPDLGRPGTKSARPEARRPFAPHPMTACCLVLADRIHPALFWGIASRVIEKPWDAPA